MVNLSLVVNVLNGVELNERLPEGFVPPKNNTLTLLLCNEELYQGLL